ncbi:MAG: putative replicase protein [Pepevirus faecivicinum]|uniref:RNA-directed RNA polymerase n=1 Tax=Leviviridae sp. TaxID=2027243 RepID=A0ABY3SVC4_9VIRU|nr:MAG: putative replicase protein [Leviviridae sp.]
MSDIYSQLSSLCEQDLGRKTPKEMPDPSQLSREDFAKDYFLYNLLRKVEPFERKDEVPVDVIRRSIGKFADSEWRCTVLNRHGRFYSALDESKTAFFLEAIRLARGWISRVMMEHWPRWEDARYTSGASSTTARKQSMSYLKWAGHAEGGKMSTTKAALGIVTNLIAPEYGPSWAYSRVSIRNHSRFDFVAKTEKTVRFIACENEYNMLAQKCVGDCIRLALYEVGIDLNDQSVNQRMSRWASVMRNQGTIDLSNASDNVALRHCEWLLTDNLLSWCLATRTPETSVDGKFSHKLQKMATMGNGFIFELQSLIYAGLAYAVTWLTPGGRESDISVYGDDIIVSTPVVEPFLQLLEWMGMEPNWEKSFWGDTPFRESCGSHWYDGWDVTPFYVKEPLKFKGALFRAVNGLRYWERRTGLCLPNAIRFLVDLIPRKERYVVPDTWSITSGLHFPERGCKFPSRAVRHGDVVYRQRAYVEKQIDIRERLDDEVLYRDWLANPPKELVPKEAWARLTLRGIRLSAFHGLPRERKAYSSVWDRASGSMLWTEREFRLGDAP